MRSPRPLVALALLGLGALAPSLPAQTTTVTTDSVVHTRVRRWGDSVTVYRTRTKTVYVPASDTADTTAPCTPAALTLCPGDNLQAKVTAAGTGASFDAGPGEFPLASVVPLANQTFVGHDSLTVFSGARALTGWQQDASGRLYVTGQTQRNTDTNSFSCAAGKLCGQAEQLWLGDAWQEPVGSLAALSAGEWFFDYAADRIYLPSGADTSAVETSVTPYAFSGSAPGVRIAHLTVQRYANGAQTGCIAGSVGAAQTGWKVDTSRVTGCHGFGIRVTGQHPRLAGNTAEQNVEGGAALLGTNSLSTGNHWTRNNRMGPNAVRMFGTGAVEEAAGLKIIATTDALIDGDTALGNSINGIWTDVAALRTTIQNSLADSNDGAGYLDEVSYQTKLLNNRACGNGRNTGTYAAAGAGIIIANSRNTEVGGNTICGNKQGIMGWETDRPKPDNYISTLGSHDVVGLRVHDNVVTQTDAGHAAGIAISGDPTAQPYSAAADNRYWHNTYHRLLGTTKWRWTNNTDIAETAWRAVQDSASTFGP